MSEKSPYVFVPFSALIFIPDGIYCGKYNAEPVVFRFLSGQVTYVQYINNSSIFLPQGVLTSSVEVLLPLQQANEMESIKRLLTPNPA